MWESFTVVGIYRPECLAMVEIQPCSKGVLQESVLYKAIFFSCRDLGYGRDTALCYLSRIHRRVWPLQQSMTCANFWAAPYSFLKCGPCPNLIEQEPGPTSELLIASAT